MYKMQTGWMQSERLELPELLHTVVVEAEQPDKSISKYGRMRQRYLKDILIPQLMKAAGVTEELKAADQMKWVG